MTYSGHGISLRQEYYTELLGERSPHLSLADVDWIEVISENYLQPGGRPWRALERVRAEVPVVLHGVSLGIGNTDPLDTRLLDDLRALCDRLEPAGISEHLCWGALGGHHSHDLLPLPHTEACIAHVVERVDRVQQHLGRRIALENVSSYLRYRVDEMPEHAFVAEVARRADCELLLDVNNVLVNAANHGFCAREYIRALPAERVRHLHLAGHTDEGDVLLDSHRGPVPDGVWDLYRDVIDTLGARPTLVEWDAEVPPLAVVAREARRAAAIERQVVRHAA